MEDIIKMDLINIKSDRDYVLKMWLETKSNYAREQVILANLGLVKLAMKKLNIELCDEDMFSLGTIGLIESMNTFDPDRGFQFSTYATQAIIHKLLRERRKSYRQKQGLAIIFSLDEKRILDNGDEISYADMIPDKTCFEEDILLKLYFEKEIGSLTKSEKEVLKLRLEGKSQSDIATIIGVSQVTISNILRKIKNKKIICQ